MIIKDQSSMCLLRLESGFCTQKINKILSKEALNQIGAKIIRF